MNTKHGITATALLILSLAVTGPAAMAAPADPAGAAKPAPATVYSRQDKSMIPATTPASTPTTSGPRSEVVSGDGYGSGTVAPTVVRIADGNSGFDWLDAAISLAGGMALTVIGLGAALAVSQHRHRRIPTPQP